MKKNRALEIICIIAAATLLIILLFSDKVCGQPGNTKKEILENIRNNELSIIKVYVDTLEKSDIEVTHIFHNDICINTILIGEDYNRRRYADLMKILKYKYLVHARVWIKNDLTGYLLYNWKLQNWYISIYNSEDFLYTH
jgi:hypothetical protein